jgi:hypothetical protein
MWRKYLVKYRILSYKKFLFLTISIFLLLIPEKSYSFTIGSNSWHLNSPFQTKHNADIVCKIKVRSIRHEEVTKGNLLRGVSDLYRTIATSDVISVIKGKCPRIIDIEFHYPKERNLNFGFPITQAYTELSKNEVCIVFLKQAMPYHKLNRIYSKLRISPEVINYNLGDTPNLRLLAEFLASCNSDNEMVRLQAAEELGYLADAMISHSRLFREDKKLFQKTAFGIGKIKEALRKMHSSEDIVIRNVSIISSFKADDSPGIEGPLYLLRMNPSVFDPNESLKKYGIKDFCIASLQLNLLETIDSMTRRAIINLKDGSVIRRKDGNPGIYRGARGFDYEDFFRQALSCEVVKKNDKMRSAIANVIWIRYEKRSVPEMIRLLDDPSMHIRQTAVSALRKCINSDFSNSWERFHFYNPQAAKEYLRGGIEKKLEERQKDYKDNEQKYIQYWKKWWQEHKSKFEIYGKAKNGAD